LTSALSIQENASERRREIEWLGNVLKAEFFSVIKGTCGKSVEKYWLTGVLPAFRDGISPLSAMRVISFDEQYQSLCGFTQEDVDAIVSRALHHFPESERDLALKSLSHWYNGYKFYPSGSVSGREIPCLYNPQLVFVQ
jgi:Predicted AAA-ATPase